MDFDGDTDLLSVSPYEWLILWHENDGSGNFINHVIHSIPNTTTWFGYCVWPADLGDDGDYDIVTGAWDSPEIRWLENDGSNTNFTPHIVDTLGLRSTTIFSDLDEDGDFDILAASQNPGALVWYENDGSQQFVKHPLPDAPVEPRNILARDLDQDGDTDIVTSDYGDIFSWLENDGEESFTKHKIPGTRRSNGLFIVDLEQDGDWDIVTGYPYAVDKMVVWLENDGQQNFTEHVIATNIDWTECTWADDVDLDGDIDVLSASQYDDKVVWFESNLKDATSVENLEAVPVLFSLHQNYPNPFNPTTTIEFSLPQNGFVTLKVYNLLGEEVATVMEAHKPAGRHTVNFDASALASGLYYYTLTAGDFNQSRKMLLLR